MLDGECTAIFRAAIRSKYALDPYELRLVAFLSGIGGGKTYDEFIDLAKTNLVVVEEMIISLLF